MLFNVMTARDWRKQDENCSYNAVEAQQCSMFVVELHVTVNYIKIPHVAQQRFMTNLCPRQK
jgi:hypothetical protein